MAQQFLCRSLHVSLSKSNSSVPFPFPPHPHPLLDQSPDPAPAPPPEGDPPFPLGVTFPRLAADAPFLLRPVAPGERPQGRVLPGELRVGRGYGGGEAPGRAGEEVVGVAVVLLGEGLLGSGLPGGGFPPGDAPLPLAGALGFLVEASAAESTSSREEVRLGRGFWGWA